MSFTEPTTEPEARTPEAQPDPDACVHCGTPMLEDQEWCLECGAARTLIHRPPDWRVPVAVIGTVVIVAAVALAVVLINLSSSADHSVITRTVVAQAPRTAKPRSTRRTTGATTAGKTTPTTTTPTGTATTATTPAAPTPPGIATWPLALSQWTVVLARYPDQATANATALRVKAEGLPVGVLNSTLHPSLKPGGWLVFTGHYSDRAQATAAAQQLRAQGHSARARRVAPTAGQ